MKKRGYFFTVDVSIAMIIIVIGFILIWSFYTAEARKEQPYFYAQDALNFLSSNTVGSVTGTIPYVQELLRDRNITNLDNTLMEQIALFYITETAGCMWSDCMPHLAENLTRNVLKDAIPPQYEAHVLFNHTSLYKTNATGLGENESTLLVSAKKMVVVVVNKVNLSDPYMMEVRVWR